MKRALFTTFLFLAVALAAAADNWPAWRGPEMNGQSRETELPLSWSATENVRWKAPLPGPGMSSPIVWGDRVFLTQALDREGHRRALLCFDRRDGKQLWQGVVDYPENESTYSGEPHYCSASPVTDGERVIAWHGSAGVVCYDFRGKELWRRDLGHCEHIWGNAASPILYRDLAILNFGPGERTFLVALDKRTGQEVWKADEPGGKYGTAPSEWLGSWSTPVVGRLNGRDELVMQWPGAVKAYAPQTGELLWTCRGLGNLSYNSALLTPEAVVALAGFSGAAIAVKPGGSGDVTDTHRLWLVEKTPQRIGSGVVVGDHLYILNAIGTAQCIEVKTGRSLWEERAGGSSWGSMVHAGGRLYVTTQPGETIVLAAKPTFEVLSRNPLGERSQSSPAISDGQIFLRTYGHLWCIGK
jgi:outer membrane protein assembly factor BamB